MKKVLSLILAAILMMSMCAFAQEDEIVNINMSASSENIEVGDQFLVSFMLDKDVEYLTVGLAGEFNTDVAKILAIQVNDNGMQELEQMRVVSQTEGVFNVQRYTLSPLNDRYLCSVLFEATNEGEFYITLGARNDEKWPLEVILGRPYMAKVDGKETAFYTLGYDKFTTTISKKTKQNSVVIKENIETDQDIRYNDLNGYDWAKDAVVNMAAKGVLKGVADGFMFNPANYVKRADIIVMLLRSASLSGEKSENQFADVDENEYYADSISIARTLGIAQGDEALNEFFPTKAITREDLCTLIYRTLVNKGTISSDNVDTSLLDKFSDKEIVSDYAKEAMAKMVESGIIEGNDDLTLNPKGNTTRAEAVVIMDRIYRLVNAF